MKDINQQEWVHLLHKSENPYILDVRTPEECASGILHDAETMDFFEMDRFMSFLETLDKSRPYFVYCRSGNRSGKVCHIMDSMGFSTTYNLLGGMTNWTGPVLKPA